jgi:hypothetical protein
MDAGERIERFQCFGAWCSVAVDGAAGERSAREAALDARRALEDWHVRFSRFRPDSELSRLNDDPRREVPAGALLVRLAAAVRMAGELSGGLVDATLIEQIEDAGYAHDLGESPAPSAVLELAPARRPAGPSRSARRRGRPHGHATARRQARQRRPRQGPVRRCPRCAARATQVVRRRVCRRPRARRSRPRRASRPRTEPV